MSLRTSIAVRATSRSLDYPTDHEADCPAGRDAAPLKWAATLGSVAENGAYTGCAGTTVNGRAHDMGQRNYFSHTILGCSQDVGNMVVAAGVSASAPGENISWASDQGTDPALLDQRPAETSGWKAPANAAGAAGAAIDGYLVRSTTPTGTPGSTPSPAPPAPAPP